MAAATTDLGSAPFWHASPVFGHGLGSFSQISSWEYPHNPCMEVLSEFGIVGAVLLFTPLLYLLAASAMRWRYVDQRTLGVFVLFFIAAQVSGDLFDSRMVFLLPILMATGALARHPHWAASISISPNTGSAPRCSDRGRILSWEYDNGPFEPGCLHAEDEQAQREG